MDIKKKSIYKFEYKSWVLNSSEASDMVVRPIYYMDNWGGLAQLGALFIHTLLDNDAKLQEVLLRMRISVKFLSWVHSAIKLT